MAAALASSYANPTIWATIVTTLESVSGAILGTLASIPVAGWIALAVIAVGCLVWYFWDDICDFFSWICGETTQMATIVWVLSSTIVVPWIVDTATDVWDSLVSAVDDVAKRAERQAKKLAAALAAATTTLIPKDDAVYRIDMIQPGTYNKLIWGAPYGKYKFPSERGGDPKYKYGTTKNGVSGRYAAGSYVGKQISLGNMSSIMIREYMNFWEARILEKMQITFYFKQHGAFPPGNSKLG